MFGFKKNEVFEDCGKSGLFLLVIKILNFLVDCSFLIKRKLLLIDRFLSGEKNNELVDNCN